jgi:hypothetical protein
LGEEPKMKKVKGKEPIDKKSDKITNETQKDSGYGLAGEITEFKKAVMFLKEVLESDYEDNPVYERDNKQYEQLREMRQQADDDANATFKEMEMLLNEYKGGQMDDKEFGPKMQNLIRMWMTEHKKVLPKPNQLR